MGERVTQSWWRRNAIALIAVAVLAPATAATISFNVWTGWNRANPTQPITVEPGASVEYSGSIIGDTQARFEDDIEGTPIGARAVAVTIEIDPGDKPISCLPPRLREVGGAQRVWSDASYDLDRPYDPERVSSCSSEPEGPYTLSVDFLVPEAVAGPFAVELWASSGLPEFLRLIIEP